MNKPLDSSPTPAGPGTAGIGQVARAAFWSFFGVRKGKHLRDDAVKISPSQIVIAGVVGTVLFVLAIVTVVQVVLRMAA